MEADDDASRTPQLGNFDHTACYDKGLHPKTKAGRQWCRQMGAASRTSRLYARRETARPIHPPHHPSSDSLVDVSAQDARLVAANRYRPSRIPLLLVAQAPPAAPDRYFYFPQVSSHDDLFRYVVRAVLRIEPTRDDKPQLLEKLAEAGVFLIDLKDDGPVDGQNLDRYVPGLVTRIRALNPENIILIKADVYTAAYESLVAAKLPVVDERIPFPGSGRQREFLAAFDRALTSVRWHPPGHLEVSGPIQLV